MTGLFQPRTGSDSCPSLKVTEEELGQVVDTGLGGTCHKWFRPAGESAGDSETGQVC